MNWEKMTEDAIFKVGEKVRIITKLGRMDIVTEYKKDKCFWMEDAIGFRRKGILKFCRMNNINEVKS